ncbi:hypothetical protein [Mycobacteroides abscessus]|uniref:hypothetical protein n=1 Tax=Mycobacteroides abscessus TaxID=36809 RepID=UPI0009A6FBC6|nr:hypothetical protein [Mycobacteroides abscessus]AWG51629.1 hypothetical protein DDT48_21065 [Mycobacteroides abscessus]MBN7377780.1 hypothetical protein [Mycobacteroides abscessus subsp. massiliense]MDM2174989.1 hypothetical protein [Mycobacteroides abscessus]MDM2177344.1 hypothetical protein [Mycobacteroides abscessus]MDM2208270.1 hypothetical protein [Mycobacteroides abscessus]
MTTAIEGEVLDVLPPPIEEKVGAMQRWTPDQQVDHVTELLVQSNVSLLVAIAAQDLPGIVEVKAKAAGIEKIAKQLHISKEMQSHAAEFVRRAERGLGVGIREAQARGEVETCNEGKARGSLVRDQVVTYDKVKPKPTDFASKHELTNTHGGIYDLADGVSDEQFEEAITEARAEGNLSRANVARKCKDKAQAAREVVDADDPLIDAAVAEPVTTKWPFRNSPTEFLAEITGSIAAFAENIKWITAGAVEPGELETLTNQARNAWKQINKHLKEINDV